MKELGSEVARQAEGSQPTQPNLNPIYRWQQTSRSSAQEIDTRFSLDCKNTYLFVERLEKEKDTDKDVDADRDNQPVRPHSSKRWTSILGCLDCHMQLWNMPKILVFVSSLRRSRVTLIDKIFKPIYSKVMLTTHLMKNQRRWFRTWAIWSYLSYARQFLKCNAQNAFFTGIKASSTALAGISWKNVRPAEAPFNGHWTFSQFKIMFRKCDLMAIVMGRLKNK